MKAMTLNQGSPQHRAYQSVGWGIFLIIVAVTPYLLPLYQVSRMNRALTYAVAILGVNLVIGYSGLIALGHSAFFGIGAFLTATLVQDENWDFWMTIPIVFAFTFIVGMILGLPALRIRGLYLALVTIAFAAVFPTLAKIDALEIGGLTIEGRTGGANGKRIDEEVIAPSWLPSSIFGDANEGEIYRYWLIALITAVLFLLTRNVLKSRPGRSIVAIRDNEIGAAVSGVNLPITKTLTFGLSSALAGVGGMMLAMDKSFAAEQDFSFTLAVAAARRARGRRTRHPLGPRDRRAGGGVRRPVGQGEHRQVRVPEPAQRGTAGHRHLRRHPHRRHVLRAGRDRRRPAAAEGQVRQRDPTTAVTADGGDRGTGPGAIGARDRRSDAGHDLSRPADKGGNRHITTAGAGRQVCPGRSTSHALE